MRRVELQHLAQLLLSEAAHTAVHQGPPTGEHAEVDTDAHDRQRPARRAASWTATSTAVDSISFAIMLKLRAKLEPRRRAARGAPIATQVFAQCNELTLTDAFLSEDQRSNHRVAPPFGSSFESWPSPELPVHRRMCS